MPFMPCHSFKEKLSGSKSLIRWISPSAFKLTGNDDISCSSSVASWNLFKISFQNIYAWTSPYLLNSLFPFNTVNKLKPAGLNVIAFAPICKLQYAASPPPWECQTNAIAYLGNFICNDFPYSRALSYWLDNPIAWVILFIQSFPFRVPAKAQIALLFPKSYNLAISPVFLSSTESNTLQPCGKIISE